MAAALQTTTESRRAAPAGSRSPDDEGEAARQSPGGARGAERGRRWFVRAVSTTLSHPLSTVRSMGRPRIYNEARVATAIRLPISLRRNLQVAATRRDVSVNYLVTRAVSEFLDRLPSTPDDLTDQGGSHQAARSSAS